MPVWMLNSGAPGADQSPPEVFRHNFGVIAHRGGVFDARVPIGARVRAGDLLGIIKHIAGEAGEGSRRLTRTIISRQSGRVVHPGSRLYLRLLP